MSLCKSPRPWLPSAPANSSTIEPANPRFLTRRDSSQTPEAHSLWVLLSIFPRCILPASKGARHADGHSQARMVRERLDRLRHGHHRELWDEAVKACKVPSRGKRKRAESELRSADDHTAAAFITFLLNSQSIRQDLLSLTEEDSQITIPNHLLTLLSTNQEEEATQESLLGVSQKAVSLQIDLNNTNLLTANLTREGVVRDIARFASLSLPHAGD